MARFVSYIDDDSRERVGSERDGEIFALPAGLTLPVLLSLGAKSLSGMVEEVAHTCVGRMGDLRLLPAVPNPGKIICLAGQMIFTAPEIVSFVSRYTTLEPGDLICTGTCAGVGASSGRFLQPGDQVVGAIEKLGELRFTIG